MNNISWFLYAVDVLGNIHAISILIVIGSIVGLIIAFFTNLNSLQQQQRYEKKSKDNNNDRDYQEWADDHGRTASACQKFISFFKYVLPIVAIFAVFTPTQKTMYLMLGSEVGEEVVNSETGRRVQDAINKKLDEYLGDDQ